MNKLAQAEHRTERDYVGEVTIPGDKLYGVDTFRGVENLTVSSLDIAHYTTFRDAFAQVKWAAALANRDNEVITADQCNAIVAACKDVIEGRFDSSFVVDLMEGSGGTSTNMNSNEVIANLAQQLLGHAPGNYKVIHPNDHVNGVVTTWNAGAQKAKGYTAEEIIGHHYSCFCSVEERTADAPGRNLNIVRTTSKYEAEGWRYRKDGTRFWAHVVIDPIYDDDGELLGFAKVTRDRTEARALQIQTRDHEHSFRLLVEGVTDYAIHMLDTNDIVSNWNAGAQRAKGYKVSEIVGKHFSCFYEPDDQERGLPQQGLDTARESGKFEAQGWRIRKSLFSPFTTTMARARARASFSASPKLHAIAARNAKRRSRSKKPRAISTSRSTTCRKACVCSIVAAVSYSPTSSSPAFSRCQPIA